MLQALGLENTTAARGAFTGTFTVLAVPILVGLSGRRVPWSTWAAAAAALTGAEAVFLHASILTVFSLIAMEGPGLWLHPWRQ
jgi:hypothetical protein